MKQISAVLCRLSERMDLPQEMLGSGTQIQLNGNRQVRVERHRGVAGYESTRIVVQAVNGRISIMGESLTIAAMNHQRILIRGCIRAVELEVC